MENVNTTDKGYIWDRRKYRQTENMDRQKIQDKHETVGAILEGRAVKAN